MKKQLVLFVMFIVSVAAKAYDACIDGIYYNLKTEATVTYKDTNYNSYSGTVVIPDFVTYNGKTYSVTKIGSLAFASCSDLTSVTIPDGVGSIEERAFYGCISLTSVNFPNSITLIGNRAFAFCSCLESVTILTGKISEYAFMSCSGLTSINIGSYVKAIGSNAFSGCSNLKSVSLESNYLVSASRTSSTSMWSIFGNQVKTYHISDDVNSIGDNAFNSCSGMTSITIGSSVNSIGQDAFSGCTSLTSVTLKSDDIVSPSRSYGTSMSSVFGQQVKNYVIDNDVKSIGERAFYGCKELTSVTIGNSVISIGEDAYRDCSSLTSVNIGDGVTNIGTAAFYCCGAITSIAIPNNVKNIGEYAFAGCSSMKSVSIGNNVKEIGWMVFQGCPALTSVIIGCNVTNIDNTAFKGCRSLCEIVYLPKIAPNGWIATSMTYVPDKQSYSSPTSIINDAQIIDMIAFNQTTFNYTGSIPTTTWINNLEGYTASLSMPKLKDEVGTYEEWVPVTFNKGNESFIANVVYRYNIKPATLIAKVTNVSRKYGEENPALTILYSGFVNNEDESVLTTKPTVSTIATKTNDVGEYPITASGGEAANYAFIYEQGVLTITKASLSAKVKDATKVYGAQNPCFSIEYYGLKNGETVPAWTTAPTFQTEATKASGVGQYAIKAINGVPVNYELEIADGTLSITPASLTIKANDATRKYYNENPAFSYKCVGFVNGDNESILTTTPTFSTSATQYSNVGTYEIKVGDAYCSNYSISYINGTLTITPCVLTASVGNYERIYKEENPVFEVKYDGFVGNENESVLNSKAIATTTATQTSDVGTYKITVSGGSADNYTFSYVPGVLTINKAEQTIIWEQNLATLKVGDQIELKATASSGLTVAYTSDNPSIAEVYAVGNKYYLDCKTEGEVWLVAVQNGNKNYYSSPRIRKNIVIGDASAINANTRAIARIEKTTSGIRVIDANIGEMVYVYTTGGQLIHSVKATDHIIDIPLAKDGVYIVKVGGKTVKLGY